MWVTAFLDFPEERYAQAVSFWEQVSGTRCSPTRGEHDEFGTLLPSGGDPWLRVQRLREGRPRVHLDIHAEDPATLRRRATALGAELIADRGHTVHRSPGGLVFCVVEERLHEPPDPVAWPHLSRVDQICIDIPEARFDEEAMYWSALLERPHRESTSPEFGWLPRGGDDWPEVLLQRCGFEGAVRAHLDIACDAENREAEVERILGLGAGFVRRTEEWTTLRDPAGLEFCVTDRHPRTGRLSRPR